MIPMKQLSSNFIISDSLCKMLQVPMLAGIRTSFSVFYSDIATCLFPCSSLL